MAEQFFRRLPSLTLGFMAVCAMLIGCSGGQKLDEPTQHLVAAKEALNKGDQALALQELDASIKAAPTGWALLERAKLKQAMGQDQEAVADCEQGLQVDPDSPELKWYLSQLKKPKTQRFHGADAEPPSASK